MNKVKIIVPAALGVALFATPAFAHPGPAGHDFIHGLTHPLTGVDHMLAMLAVGFWAATRAPRKAWQAPATFLACLAIGAVAGVLGGAAAFVEPLVAGSLVAMAALLLFAPMVADLPALALIGLFALLHGYAHGGEASGGLAGYFAGFLVMSAALHLGGWRVGTALFAHRAARWTAAIGVGVTGLMLSFG